ncbi:MAG: ABC transporter ATP-binding protein [Oscillospiraceae bacterium]|nr:ABC transporter ATP-binding protein [Oscillospiraceae bacterium]
MAFIKLNHITRSYKSGKSIINALDNVSFEIEKGDFTVILGPSGSGKSTLLNLVGGMDFPTQGEIIVDGSRVETLNERQLTKYRRENIGFVFQFYNLIPNLTAFENVDLANRLSPNAHNSREIMEIMGLKDRMRNFPAEMSGGEQQRVSIARAICKNPKIMLCDEPTGALDSTTGKNVLITLQEMAKYYGNAVIVVTHNTAIASSADRLVRLKDGKVESITNNVWPELIENVEW